MTKPKAKTAGAARRPTAKAKTTAKTKTAASKPRGIIPEPTPRATVSPPHDGISYHPANDAGE